MRLLPKKSKRTKPPFVYQLPVLLFIFGFPQVVGFVWKHPNLQYPVALLGAGLLIAMIIWLFTDWEFRDAWGELFDTPGWMKLKNIKKLVAKKLSQAKRKL